MLTREEFLSVRFVELALLKFTTLTVAICLYGQKTETFVPSLNHGAAIHDNSRVVLQALCLLFHCCKLLRNKNDARLQHDGGFN